MLGLRFWAITEDLYNLVLPPSHLASIIFSPSFGISDGSDGDTTYRSDTLYVVAALNSNSYVQLILQLQAKESSSNSSPTNGVCEQLSLKPEQLKRWELLWRVRHTPRDASSAIVRSIRGDV